MSIESLILLLTLPPLIMGVAVGVAISHPLSPRDRLRRFILLWAFMVVIGGVLASVAKLSIDNRLVQDIRKKVQDPADEYVERWGPFLLEFRRDAALNTAVRTGSTMSRISSSKGEIIAFLVFGIVGLPVVTSLISGVYLLVFGFRKTSTRSGPETDAVASAEPDWSI